MKIAAETVERIAGAVPIEGAASSLDIWKSSNGISHQTVKNGLKALVDAGRLMRTSERFNTPAALGSRTRYVYQRVRQ